MKYNLVLANSFKKDLKKIIKRKYDIKLMDKVVELLLYGEKIPRVYKDHQLKGNMKEFRELHITPDWLLIYKRNEKEIILTLTRTGTHSDLLNG